jgi:hypothetical protein
MTFSNTVWSGRDAVPVRDNKGGAFGQPGFARIFLVEARNDPQHGRLAGAVRAENADLGVGIEGQVDVFEDLLGAEGLVEAGHVIDELTCHRVELLRGREGDLPLCRRKRRTEQCETQQIRALFWPGSDALNRFSTAQALSSRRGGVPSTEVASGKNPLRLRRMPFNP